MKSLLLAALLISIPFMPRFEAAAHPGGHGPITQEEVKQLATVVTQDLTQRDLGLGFGQLEQSWSEVPMSKVGIHAETSTYFIVSVRNDAVDKTLYVLISTLGEIYDANMTGTFEGLADDDAGEESKGEAPGVPSP